MGRRKRSVRENTKHEINTAFDKLINDHAHGRLHLGSTVIRPAYAYTSQCFNKDMREGVTPGNYMARIKE